MGKKMGKVFIKMKNNKPQPGMIFRILISIGFLNREKYGRLNRNTELRPKGRIFMLVVIIIFLIGAFIGVNRTFWSGLPFNVRFIEKDDKLYYYGPSTNGQILLSEENKSKVEFYENLSLFIIIIDFVILVVGIIVFKLCDPKMFKFEKYDDN